MNNNEWNVITNVKPDDLDTWSKIDDTWYFKIIDTKIYENETYVLLKGYNSRSSLLDEAITGHFTGYVGVSPSHKLHGKWYDEVHIECFRGLTWSGDLHKDIIKIIPVENIKDYYFFGFDTNHIGKEVIDSEFIDNECKKILTQLKDYEEGINNE